MVKEIVLVDNAYPFTYLYRLTPKTYKCSVCGKEHVKLWCFRTTFPMSMQKFLCASCVSNFLATITGKPVFKRVSKGTYTWVTPGKRIYIRHRISDYCIESFMPAIPTEQNHRLLLIKEITPEAINWWLKLPKG